MALPFIKRSIESLSILTGRNHRSMADYIKCPPRESAEIPTEKHAAGSLREELNPAVDCKYDNNARGPTNQYQIPDSLPTSYDPIGPGLAKNS
jgi:hypothetical protein